MAKGVHLTHSKEHGSPGDRHVDSYRQKSDSQNVEKVAHTPADPDYNKEKEVRVNVKKS